MSITQTADTYSMNKWVNNDPILRTLHRRLWVEDRNALIIVIGDTGSRKSGSSLTMATLMDCDPKTGKTRFYKRLPDGSIDLSRVVFSSKEFVNLVKSDLPKGSWIIWDETGVDNDNLQFASLKARLVKYVMQTFRFKNLGVLMTVPDMPSITIGVRRLLHANLEMSGMPRRKDLYHLRNKIAEGSWCWVLSDKKKGFMYNKNQRYYDLNTTEKNKLIRINPYYIPKPPAELEDAYKIKKQKATDKMYKEFDAELSFMKNTISGDEETGNFTGDLSPAMTEAEVMKSPMKFFNTEKNKFEPDVIQMELGVKITTAKRVATFLNFKYKKGDLNLTGKTNDIELISEKPVFKVDET